MKHMFEGYQNTEELTRNLIDVGCSETIITCFLACLFNGDKAGSLNYLETWRAELLERIHNGQSCIEFLDEQLSSLRGQSK